MVEEIVFGLRGFCVVRAVNGGGSSAAKGVDRACVGDESAQDVAVVGQAFKDRMDVALVFDFWKVEGVQGGLVGQSVVLRQSRVSVKASQGTWCLPSQ